MSTPHPISTKHPLPARPKQSGFVLVFALIMMAVIAIGSAAAIRGAQGQDRIGSNQRSTALASQVAETALRYCEALVSTPLLSGQQIALSTRVQPAFVPNATRPNQTRWWQDMSSWEGSSSRAFSLPSNFAYDGSTAMTFNRAPQCLVERLELRDLTSDFSGQPLEAVETYVITARGFSPDYQAQNNVPTTGAVVWLQSIVQIKRGA